jgi:hypothetical protein
LEDSRGSFVNDRQDIKQDDGVKDCKHFSVGSFLILNLFVCSRSFVLQGAINRWFNLGFTLD